MTFNTHDQVPDSPTNNFATLNSLDAEATSLSDGNLDAGINNGPNNSTTIIPLSGTWYWEVYIRDHTNIYMGIQKIETQATGYSQDAVAVNNTGNIYYDSIYQNIDALPNITTGDIISVFWNIDNNMIWFAQNGQFYDATGTSHPPLTLSQVANGVNGYDYSNNIPYRAKPFFGSSAPSAYITCNFGQDSSFGGRKTSGSAYASDANGIGNFYYQPPTGALALCSANLPKPSTDPNNNESPDNYFKTISWDGTGSPSQDINVGFWVDFIWVKRTNGGDHHYLYDITRTENDHLESDNDNPEGTDDYGLDFVDYGGKIQVESNKYFNNSGNSFVAWCWTAGGAQVNATNPYAKNGNLYSSLNSAGIPTGQLTPTRMSINTQSGFSIIKYDGTSGTNTRVPHGLSSTPELIIIKNLAYSSHWVVGSEYMTSWRYAMNLSEPNQEVNYGYNVFRSDPNSSFFYLGYSVEAKHPSFHYIAYCWHSVPGYSAIGKYTGNGNSDGPFIHTGFKPALVITKRSNGNGQWILEDNERNPINPVDNVLYANDQNQAGTTSNTIDFLSNGFKIRHSAWSDQNGTSATIIYMAFAEQPGKYSNAR